LNRHGTGVFCIISQRPTYKALSYRRSTTYFVVIGRALAFGVFLAAAVRAFLPKDWFLQIAPIADAERFLGAGRRARR
jgi:hypothetical protein